MTNITSTRGVSQRPSAVAAAIATAISTSFFGAPALAQTVEEIIVTTRYEEESLQEVPIAVTAIGSAAIERQDLSDLFKVADLDPSVSFDTSYGPGDTRVAIRGLSNTRGRSNVAFLVDGVDVTTENQIAAGSGLLVNQRLLTDVERVEIVKGPQSALYGRAAFAGAIAYTTKNPTDEFEGTLGVNLAQFNEYQMRGSFSGPLTDTLGARVDAVGWSSDGAYDNSVSGADLGGGQGWATALKLAWEPTDRFDIKGRISWSEEENAPRPITTPVLDTFYPYPMNAIDAEIGVGNSFGFPASVGAVNHGTFCPDLGVLNDGNPLDPNFNNTLPGVAPGTPGICQPGGLGSISDLPNGKRSIAHSETLDGTDQPGSTLDIFRTSMTANWDTDAGLWTFIGGYTTAAQTDIHDQDFQAFGRPDRLGQNDPFYDYGNTLSIGHQQADTETDTRQLSGEIRFSTNFEGPVNATAGYLRWDQKVTTLDRNYIANCALASTDFTPGSENVITGLPSINSNPLPGLCDGFAPPNPVEVGLTGGVPGAIPTAFVGSPTLTSWQAYQRQFLATPGLTPIDPRTDVTPGRIPGAFWQSDTKHQSFYLQVQWDILDNLKLTAEGRWVDERFDIQRPNQASCANIALGFYTPNGASTALGGAWVEEGAANVFAIPGFPSFPATVPDLNCSSVTGYGTFTDWAIIEGSADSDFITPKATLEWFVNDTDMLYFSVAKGQKPGGISQLAAGGSAVTIEELSFLPEKMWTYELGAKTSWEAAGTLIANGAIFFNDYTDKQVSTQELVDGVLRPRVANASAAEVLGVEVDFMWYPSAIDGLMLRAAYTWQDGEYKDYQERTSSIIRAGLNGGCDVVPVKGQENDPDPELECNLDLSGKQLERQAKNAFSGSFSYVQPFEGSANEWFVEGDVIWNDKRYLDQDNATYFEAYWLTNLRAGVQSDEWDIVLFVDNVLDDDTFRTGGAGPDFALQASRLGFSAGLGVNGYFVTLPDPRTVGIRTTFRFGR